MNYKIGNEYLSVEISSLGAEIQSVKSKDGTEYIWQGDPAYWKDRAINLFPYIGYLPENGYLVDGERYNMDLHGFLKDSETEAIETGDKEKSAISFRLRDSETTLRQYPFPFVLLIDYKLNKNKLEICFSVENTGGQTMYFGIGGHPGFALPLEPGLVYDDYYLEFEEGYKPYRRPFNEVFLMRDYEEEFPLRDGNILDLSHRLFDNFALILRNTGPSVALKSRGGERGVKLDFPDMFYLGLWKTPKSDAPFLCIEPWTSISAIEGADEELKSQPDLMSLAAGALYNNEWSITFY